jgi:basic amino acid/polyamine antiporter, APA family
VPVRPVSPLYATAFTGFTNPAVGAGEATNPRRNVAFAAAASFAIVTALYVGTQWACISLVPNLAHSEQPIADAIGGAFGENAARVVAGGAVVMLLGTLLAIAFTMSRTLFALAEQHQLPRLFARIHPTFRTPYVAIVTSGAVAFATTLLTDFVTAVAISTVTTLITYLVIAAALIALRAKNRMVPPPIVIPAGKVVASLTIAVCIALITLGTADELRAVAIAIAAGAVVYASSPLRARRLMARS